MDYNPKLWGAASWSFLEYTALGYPDQPTEEDKKHYKELFTNLEFTLPCKECRMNYGLHIIETPIDVYLKNSYSLYEWVIMMKNKVNRILEKPHVDHEKRRMASIKRNLVSSNKPCCGNKTGNPLTIKQKERKLQTLQKNIRAKKNELLKVKALRKFKKRRE